MKPLHNNRRLKANPPQYVRLKRSPLMDDLRMKFPEGWFVTGKQNNSLENHQILNSRIAADLSLSLSLSLSLKNQMPVPYFLHLMLQ